MGQQTNLDRHLRKHENDGPTILDGLGPRAKSYLVRMAPRAVAAVVAATQAAAAAATSPNGSSPRDSPLTNSSTNLAFKSNVGGGGSGGGSSGENSSCPDSSSDSGNSGSAISVSGGLTSAPAQTDSKRLKSRSGLNRVTQVEVAK